MQRAAAQRACRKQKQFFVGINIYPHMGMIYRETVHVFLVTKAKIATPSRSVLGASTELHADESNTKTTRHTLHRCPRATARPACYTPRPWGASACTACPTPAQGQTSPLCISGHHPRCALWHCTCGSQSQCWQGCRRRRRHGTRSK